MSYEYQYDTDRYPVPAYPENEHLDEPTLTPYDKGLFDGVTYNLSEELIRHIDDADYVRGYLDGVREAIASKRYLLSLQGKVKPHPDSF
jgi:hypothetical protein